MKVEHLKVVAVTRDEKLNIYNALYLIKFGSIDPVLISQLKSDITAKLSQLLSRNYCPDAEEKSAYNALILLLTDHCKFDFLDTSSTNICKVLESLGRENNLIFEHLLFLVLDTIIRQEIFILRKENEITYRWHCILQIDKYALVTYREY